jgi:hypothetical protein
MIFPLPLSQHSLFDHYPLALGGTNADENLATLCNWCNREKEQSNFSGEALNCR